MSYNIENIFICLAAPFLIAAVSAKGDNRKNCIFIVFGFLCCVISAYLNTFFTILYGTDNHAAVLEITPVIEEAVKLLPLLFYLFVFEADAYESGKAVFDIAVGFATFENICYLLENGTDNLFHLLVRGFSTGAMHIACAYIIVCGLILVRRSYLLKTAGLFGLLCITITFHAIFNMLMKSDGITRHIGYAIPITVIVFQLAIRNRFKKFFEEPQAGL